MKRGRNSTADCKGGSTFVDAGSIPVGSTIQQRRDEAARILEMMDKKAFGRANTVSFVANWGFKSPSWVRRRLRHLAYWRPDVVIRLFWRNPPHG